MKFTNTLVLNVLYLRTKGFKYREIAERLGIGHLQVQSCLFFAREVKWKPPERLLESISYSEVMNPPLRLTLINLKKIQQQLIEILEPSNN